MFNHRPLGEAVVAKLVVRNRAMTRQVAEAAHLWERLPPIGPAPGRTAQIRFDAPATSAASAPVLDERDDGHKLAFDPPLFQDARCRPVSGSGSPLHLAQDDGGPVGLGQTANDRDVYFIMTGRLRAVSHGVRQDLIFSDMDAGSFFGELAALDGGPRSLSVFAVNNSMVAKMPSAIFVETMFTHRPLGEAVVATLVARNRAMTRRVGELGALDVRSRVHAELLRLARPDREDPKRAIILAPPEPVGARLAHQHAARNRVARDQRHGARRPDRAPARRDRDQ